MTRLLCYYYFFHCEQACWKVDSVPTLNKVDWLADWSVLPEIFRNMLACHLKNLLLVLKFDPRIFSAKWSSSKKSQISMSMTAALIWTVIADWRSVHFTYPLVLAYRPLFTVNGLYGLLVVLQVLRQLIKYDYASLFKLQTSEVHEGEYDSMSITRSISIVQTDNRVLKADWPRYDTGEQDTWKTRKYIPLRMRVKYSKSH